MQLECVDESRACWVGLQSTPSSLIRATVEGREIVSAADGSAAVEEIGDVCVITTWAASASDVCAGLASRLARGDGRFQRRGQPLRFSDCARGLAFSRGLGRRGFRHRAQRAERLASQFVVARIGGPGSRTRNPVR
jgi:hypothetical protein